ncbi:hypothetical protein B8W67_08185 [Mycolicibacillus koreensis]|uniref:Uncharacterized protein n=2 Tax=Mycolicibacillus koreensis TaxID=1069220 RepID=A0AA91PF84_9MYCO|nr:hypothetical protein B8W67_08185 [Mycolicibacillus koreensis]
MDTMDVVLGVSVTDEEARIVLSDAAAAESVIDESRVAVGGGDIDPLVSTLASTDRALTDTGHRLVATRVSATAAAQGDRLVQALTAAGLAGVTVEPAADPPTAAGPLVAGASTTAAPVVADGAATELSPAMPPTAAAAAVNPSDTADPGMTTLSPQGEQLAYSEVDEGDDLEGFGDYDGYGGAGGVADGTGDDWANEPTATGPASVAAHRPRALLLGSTVAAAVVVGFAALAVGVAIGVKPVNSQQAIRTQDDAVPGKYFPTSPGQGVQPDADNWTVVEQLPPPGVTPTVRTFEPKSLTKPVNSATSLIDMYPDGTFGVRDATAPLPAPPAVIPPAPGVPVVPGAVDPLTQLLVARLIPDFSRYTPVDVLYYMSNLVVPSAVESAAMVGANVLTNMVAGVAGPSLADLGSVVAVSPTQGALFAAPATVTATSAAASAPFDPATVTTSIPREFFSATATPEQKSALLPEGVTEISELPSTADTPGVSPLTVPITDVDGLKPTLVGTGPAVAPEQSGPPVFPDLATSPTSTPTPGTESPLTTPASELRRSGQPSEPAVAPDTSAEQSEERPSEAPPSSETPGQRTAVTSEPSAPAATPSATDKPSTKPAPSRKPAPSEEPSEAPRAPTTQAPVEAPTEAPAPVTEAPTRAPVEAPAEAPTQEAPPQRQAPPEAPVEVPTQAPKPQPQEPAPVQPAPVQPAPVQQAPVQQAPVQQAPSKPDVTMPDLKMPDFGGDSSE